MEIEWKLNTCFTFSYKKKKQLLCKYTVSHSQTWNWVLVLITGLSKSSDLGILLQETHLKLVSTSLATFKKIWVKNLEILHQQP